MRTKPTFQFTLTSILAMALLAVPVLSGCDRDEVKGAAPTASKESADSHGHDHGGAEGHDEKGHKEGGDEHAHEHGHSDEVKLTEAAAKANGVRTETAKARHLSTTVNAPARIAFNPERTAHVGSAITGRVRTLDAKVGDEVKKGDALLTIESPELGEAQSDYLQKRTSAEVAANAIALAQSSYDRAKKLYDQSQGTSLNEVQRRESDLRTAQGAAATSKAAATSAANRLALLGMSEEEVMALEKTGTLKPVYTIRAPISGQVTDREVTLGELVSPDKDSLLVITDLSTVWVLADVPEASLLELSLGSKATIEVIAGGHSEIQGTVSFIAPELDPSTRTARVRIEVPNQEKRLRAGMFARVSISAGSAEAEPVVAVPEDAVQTVEGEPCVFVPVKGEPNTFAKRQVGTGTVVGGMVPILAGLKEGEEYVSSGSFILKAEIGKEGAAHEH